MRGARAARVRAGGLVVWCLLLAAGTADDAVGAAAAPPANPSLGHLVVSSVGPGYAVTAEGPLLASEFAATAPDPAIALTALAPLSRTVPTYVRVWENDGEADQVQDLLVRFPSVGGAQGFLRAVQRAFGSGEVVGSGPLAPIPGARRTVYFVSGGAGVGQVVTLRVGTAVDLLSFLSRASGHAPPISPADALRVARAQEAVMVRTSDRTSTAPGGAPRKGASSATVGWAALVVAVLAVAVATPVILRRRGARTPTSGTGAPIGSQSPS